MNILGDIWRHRAVAFMESSLISMDLHRGGMESPWSFMHPSSAAAYTPTKQASNLAVPYGVGVGVRLRVRVRVSDRLRIFKGYHAPATEKCLVEARFSMESPRSIHGDSTDLNGVSVQSSWRLRVLIMEIDGDSMEIHGESIRLHKETHGNLWRFSTNSVKTLWRPMETTK